MYKRAQRDNVLEAVIRFRAAGDSYGRKASTLVFVAVSDENAPSIESTYKDPSDALINRFRNSGFKVLRWSQAKRVKNPPRRDMLGFHPIYYDIFTDISTGETGTPMAFGSMRWSSPGRASVYADAPSGIDDYVVVKRDGSWSVADRSMFIIH